MTAPSRNLPPSGGRGRQDNPGDPVYAPNSYGGPKADARRASEPAGWEVSGEIMRSAYAQHRDDDDFIQPGELWRTVMTETDREHLVSNVVGHVKGGVLPETVDRVIEYWRKVDPDAGARVAKALGNGG